MPPAARYEEPFHWWGPGWEPTPRHGLAALLRGGTLDIETAAHCWAIVASGRSLTVIGGPSGLGKSTLLWALAELLPAGTRRLYLRGCYESFAFLDDPEVNAATSALLINEISPHLPVYLWGPGVERALAATRRGFPLLATAHGATTLDFVATLTGSPLRIPAATVAACEHVALLEPSAQSASGRQVTGLWRLRPTRHGLDINPVLHQPEVQSNERHAGEALSTSRPAADLHRDLTERRSLLAMLKAGQIDRLPIDKALQLAPGVVSGGGTGALVP